jgi:hypothetical protein
LGPITGSVFDEGSEPLRGRGVARPDGIELVRVRTRQRASKIRFDLDFGSACRPRRPLLPGAMGTAPLREREAWAVIPTAHVIVQREAVAVRHAHYIADIACHGDDLPLLLGQAFKARTMAK